MADELGPSRARIFDYWLVGHNHTEADRAAADAIERVNPGVRRMAENNGLFTARAVGWAMHHAAQVIDLSAGFPHQEGAYQAARAARPGALVVYVGADPEVTDLLDALLYGDRGGLTVVRADFREPHAVLDDPQLRKVIDLDAPVCLLFSLALDIMPAAGARHLVVEYTRRIAPGSYIAISCPRIDDPVMRKRITSGWWPPPPA